MNNKAHETSTMFMHMNLMNTAKNLQSLMINRFCAEAAAKTLFFCKVIDFTEYKGVSKKIDLLNIRNSQRISAEKMGIAA